MPIVTRFADSPVGHAGKLVQTELLSCPALTTLISADTVLLDGPAGNILIETLAVESTAAAPGGFIGVGQDIGLYEDTEFRVRLILTCQ